MMCPSECDSINHKYGLLKSLSRKSTENATHEQELKFYSTSTHSVPWLTVPDSGRQLYTMASDTQWPHAQLTPGDGQTNGIKSWQAAIPAKETSTILEKYCDCHDGRQCCEHCDM